MPRAARAESGPDARERILEAALEAFSENGFEGAKTRDIAARARVTLGLVQYYYGSKLDLWKAAVDHCFVELGDSFDRALEGTDAMSARDCLRRLLHSHVHFVAHKPEFVRLMHDEGKRRGPRTRWLVDRYVKPMHARLAPLIDRAQSEGLLPPHPAPTHFIYAMVGAVGMIFHQAEECRRVSGIDPGDPDVAEAHALAIEHLFLGPSREESPA